MRCVLCLRKRVGERLLERLACCRRAGDDVYLCALRRNCLLLQNRNRLGAYLSRVSVILRILKELHIRDRAVLDHRSDLKIPIERTGDLARVGPILILTAACGGCGVGCCCSACRSARRWRVPCCGRGCRGCRFRYHYRLDASYISCDRRARYGNLQTVVAVENKIGNEGNDHNGSDGIFFKAGIHGCFL